MDIPMYITIYFYEVFSVAIFLKMQYNIFTITLYFSFNLSFFSFRPSVTQYSAVEAEELILFIKTELHASKPVTANNIFLLFFSFAKWFNICWKLESIRLSI